MKIFKRILLLVLVIITITVVYNYPKLNMIAGYAAKNAASSVFVADRDLDFTNKTDNNFSPINLAESKVNKTAIFIYLLKLSLHFCNIFYIKGRKPQFILREAVKIKKR